MDVQALIRQRAAERSQPGARRDPHRLALCIEGGAMRGVVSGGMVAALEQLDLLPVFDRVYGSSAGALNAAFFLAGQAAFGTTIYYENINNRQFIDFRRMLGSRPVVDLDFLVWDVMCGPKRLDVDRVVRSPIGLRTIATDVSTGARATFDGWRDGADLLACLRAGASMPVFAGRPYRYRDGKYWDALLTEPIPAASAEEDGFTHLLVLLTRPQGSRGPELSLMDRFVVLPRVRAESEDLARRFLERPRRYRELVQTVCAGRGPQGRSVALAVTPAAPAVGRLECAREKLVAGAREGMRAVAEALGFSAASLVLKESH